MTLSVWKFLVVNREMTANPDIPGWGVGVRVAAVVAETEADARRALEAFAAEEENSHFNPGWLRFAAVERIDIVPGAFVTWVEQGG